MWYILDGNQNYHIVVFMFSYAPSFFFMYNNHIDV